MEIQNALEFPSYVFVSAFFSVTSAFAKIVCSCFAAGIFVSLRRIIHQVEAGSADGAAKFFCSRGHLVRSYRRALKLIVRAAAGGGRSRQSGCDLQRYTRSRSRWRRLNDWTTVTPPWDLSPSASSICTEKLLSMHWSSASSKRPLCSGDSHEPSRKCSANEITALPAFSTSFAIGMTPFSGCPFSAVNQPDNPDNPDNPTFQGV